jgi:hypothetical protein
MKSWKLIAFVMLLCLRGYPQDQFVFKPLRQDEDYSFLKNDTTNSWYHRMKYTPLGNHEHYLSIGGDARYQAYFYKNEGWGADPDSVERFIMSRFIAHADFHWGHSLRTFVQLQSSLIDGKQFTNPNEENPLDFQQLFLEYQLLHNNRTDLYIRIGRQELQYGSERIISTSEGSGNRQSFDGFKARISKRYFAADMFYCFNVKDEKGIFDDKFFNKEEKLFGLYITSNNIPVLKNVDLYYLGLLNKKAVFDDGTGKEMRHSLGIRVSDNSIKWSYDFESVYQFGTFSNKQIKAWGISSNTAYSISSKGLLPQIGLKTELISGDRKFGDNGLQTFNALFPKGGYFGLAALIGPANLFDLHPSVTVALQKNILTATIDYAAFWRFSENDGIYGPNIMLIFSGKGSKNKFIGHQFLSHLDYAPNGFLSFVWEFTFFHPEGFLKDVSPGKNLIFSGVTCQLFF